MYWPEDFNYSVSKKRKKKSTPPVLELLESLVDEFPVDEAVPIIEDIYERYVLYKKEQGAYLEQLEHQAREMLQYERTIDAAKELLHPRAAEIEALQREMSLRTEGLTEKERTNSGLFQEESLQRMAGILLQETEKKLHEESRQKKNLQGQNLSGQDLSGQNFAGGDFRATELQGANLQEAKLMAAFLQKANLRGAVLIKTDLWGTQLQGADLRETWLRGANLIGTNLQDADLNLADLRKTDLQETFNLTIEQLAKAIVDETTKLPADITLEAIQKVRRAAQQATEAKPPAPTPP